MKSLGFTNQDNVDDYTFQSRTHKIEKYVDTIQELICSLPHGAKNQGFLEELHDSRLLVLEQERVQNEKEGAMIEYKKRCMDAALYLFQEQRKTKLFDMTVTSENKAIYQALDTILWNVSPSSDIAKWSTENDLMGTYCVFWKLKEYHQKCLALFGLEYKDMYHEESGDGIKVVLQQM